MARPLQGWPKGPMPVTPRSAHPPATNPAPPKLPHSQLYSQYDGSVGSQGRAEDARGRKRPSAPQQAQYYQPQQGHQLQPMQQTHLGHQMAHQPQTYGQHSGQSQIPYYGQYQQPQQGYQQVPQQAYQPPQVRAQPQSVQQQAQPQAQWQAQPHTQQAYQPAQPQPQPVQTYQQPQPVRPQPQPVQSQVKPAPQAPAGGLADLLGGSDDEDDDEFFEVVSQAAVAQAPVAHPAQAVQQQAVPQAMPQAMPQAQPRVQPQAVHQAPQAQTVHYNPMPVGTPEPARIKHEEHHDYVDVLREGRKQPKAPEQIRSLSPRIMSLSPRQKRVTRKQVVDTATFQPNLDRARRPMRKVFGRDIDRSASATFKSSVRRSGGWGGGKRSGSAGVKGRLTTVEKMPVRSTFEVKDPQKPNALFASRVPRAAFLEKENSYVLHREKPGRGAHLRQAEVVNRLHNGM